MVCSLFPNGRVHSGVQGTGILCIMLVGSNNLITVYYGRQQLTSQLKPCAEVEFTRIQLRVEACGCSRPSALFGWILEGQLLDLNVPIVVFHF